MRRVLITIFSVVGLSLLSVAEASAQIDFGKALGTLLNEAQQAQPTENPYAKIKANAPARSKILGSWHYLSARVEYLGINSLAQVAIPQLESFVLSELKRNGIVEGCCSLTLNRNGVAVIGTLDSLYEGKYTYDPTSAKFKATYIYNNREYAMGGYLRFVSSRLVVLIDMRDILRELLAVRPSLATDENFIMVKGVVDSFGDIYVSVLFNR